MSDYPSSHRPGRRDVIKTGIFAGIAAALPWELALADLPQIARDRTMILV